MRHIDLVHSGRSVLTSLLASVLVAACGGDNGSGGQRVPADVQKILNKPRYSGATWGLHVIDLDTGEVLHDLNADRRLLIASVRKMFSVGLALDALGPDHRFRTPIHRLGSINASGVLDGHLVLVASGDPAMGGRANPDGTYAIPDYDHNEANGLGNAVLPTPDPLAGFDRLARQVAASGITRVAGDVVVDERLFEKFKFRGEFDLSPMFVNDDVVDVLIDATGAVDWRPRSAAFTVQSSIGLGAAGSAFNLTLDPVLPACFGTPGCSGRVTGSLPAGFVPPLTGQFPLIRTFRITNPAAYARTVLIEALGRAGVTVAAAAVALNPVGVLPASRTYDASTRVAELVSHPYADTARHVMKVSYNIGADASLLFFGLKTRNANTLAGALAVEQQELADRFGIGADAIHFVDGSGDLDTAATPFAVTRLLQVLSRSPNFKVFRDAEPILGTDGSLAFVTDFTADPSLAGAKGQVWAKTGTYLVDTPQGSSYEAQALAGYITSRSGRRLAFALTVNQVGSITGIDEVLSVFQDEGTIAAALWKNH